MAKVKEEEKTLKTSEARRRANLKYQRKFVHASINMPRELREKLNEYCDENGTSVQRLVLDYLESLVKE